MKVTQQAVRQRDSDGQWEWFVWFDTGEPHDGREPEYADAVRALNAAIATATQPPPVRPLEPWTDTAPGRAIQNAIAEMDVELGKVGMYAFESVSMTDVGKWRATIVRFYDSDGWTDGWTGTGRTAHEAVGAVWKKFRDATSTVTVGGVTTPDGRTQLDEGVEVRNGDLLTVSHGWSVTHGSEVEATIERADPLRVLPALEPDTGDHLTFQCSGCGDWIAPGDVVDHVVNEADGPTLRALGDVLDTLDRMPDMQPKVGRVFLRRAPEGVAMEVSGPGGGGGTGVRTDCGRATCQHGRMAHQAKTGACQMGGCPCASWLEP